MGSSQLVGRGRLRGWCRLVTLVLLLWCGELAKAWNHRLSTPRTRPPLLLQLWAHKDNHCDDEQSVPSFVIRTAQESDLVQAAEVVTEAFFKHKTNFFTYQVERLQTFASLSSSWQTYNLAPQARYRMMVVVVDEPQQQVVGFCQMDDCPPPRGEINPAPRPYLANLAIAERVRRMGLAQQLVEQCERMVRHDWNQTVLHLRAEASNEAATTFYRKCGYDLVSTSVVDAKGETTLLFRKSLVE